jgi:hypothetical protein
VIMRVNDDINIDLCRGPKYTVFNITVMCGVCGFHPIDLKNRIGKL